MAWDLDQKTYLPTLWPSPYDGNPLPPADAFVFFNTVGFDILRPFPRKNENLNFFQQYNFQLPSSLVQDIYLTTLSAVQGSLVLYQNKKLLTLNTHYTYDYSTRKIRLIHLVPSEGETTIGIVYARYIPLDTSILYSEEDLDIMGKTYAVVFHRETTQYVYEHVNGLREAIESAWKFLRKDPPLWVGGPDNQNFGANNLVKYVTPISITHLASIATEIIALNDYCNLKFGRAITVDFSVPTDPTALMTEDLVKRFMVAMGALESILAEVSGIAEFAASLVLT